MIKIDKDYFPPEVRFTQKGHPYKGQLKWRVFERKLITDFNSNPIPFQTGKYAFTDEFGYTEFRNALENCQGPKCCYCEKPVAGGAIEHFRPKKGWQQNRGDALTRPGYYWLAYRWENMLISCDDCNKSGQKGNYFPIQGVRSVYPSNCNSEQNIIINPSKEDPSEFISFNEDIPVGIDSNGRGDANIQIFKLKNRADLKAIRYDRFFIYKTQQMIASLTKPYGPFTQTHIEEAKKFIIKAKRNKEPFSGMLRENIKRGLL